jgi:hypothetical protein
LVGPDALLIVEAGHTDARNVLRVPTLYASRPAVRLTRLRAPSRARWSSAAGFSYGSLAKSH